MLFRISEPVAPHPKDFPSSRGLPLASTPTERKPRLADAVPVHSKA
jgi:hypothetical protein